MVTQRSHLYSYVCDKSMFILPKFRLISLIRKQTDKNDHDDHGNDNDTIEHASDIETKSG